MLSPLSHKESSPIVLLFNSHQCSPSIAVFYSLQGLPSFGQIMSESIICSRKSDNFKSREFQTNIYVRTSLHTYWSKRVASIYFEINFVASNFQKLILFQNITLGDDKLPSISPETKFYSRFQFSSVLRKKYLL